MNTSFEDHPDTAVIKISNRDIPCTFKGVAGRRLTVECSEEVKISTAISVEFSDALFLGEVVACVNTLERQCELEIKVEQILTGLQSLMNLRAALIGEPVPEPLALAPVTNAT